MTDASTIVATIESRPARGVPDVSGSTRRPADRAKEAVKTEGKTFADSLKDAQSRQTEASEKTSKPAKARKGTKSETSPRAAKSARRSVRSGSAAVPAPASGRPGSAVSTAVGSVRNDRPEIRNTENIDHADEAVVLKAAVPEDQAALVQVSKAALPRTETRVQSDGKSGRADSGTGTEAVTAKRAKADAIDDAGLKSADLSSRSGRVEVIDNREFSKIEGKITSAPGPKDRAASARTRGDAPVRSEAAPATASRSDGFAVAESDIEISPAAGRGNTGRSAAAELARKLDGEAGGDIVRQVKVIINRSNAGEVRINLRPDNLGRVRVRIQLEDNRLTGRIFVESAAARDAFRDAIDGLQTKLVEAGFGAADLELAWDESAQNFADGGRQNGGRTADSGQSAREFENTVPVTIVDEAGDGRVNLVV